VQQDEWRGSSATERGKQPAKRVRGVSYGGGASREVGETMEGRAGRILDIVAISHPRLLKELSLMV